VCWGARPSLRIAFLELAHADPAINRLISEQRLTQITAAERLEVTQPKVSSLKNYKLDGFSVERLMSFLLALGQDVEIRIRPRRAVRSPGRIVVHASHESSARNRNG
jgi:predicted XRE-type DNA-binding protein